MHRAAAALIALVAWVGLAVQFNATLAHSGSILGTIWILLRFFTVITNLLLALTMTGIALGWRVNGVWLGGVTIAILLVGVVYAVLLRGLVELSGGALLADALLHKVTPVLAGLYWLFFAPRGGLRWTDAVRWSLYPLGYFAYALVRGSLEGRYAYPFMDVGKIGAAQTALNALAIAAAFVVAGLGLVSLDRALAARRNGGLITPQGNL
jgi:hypothetical protein